jgi:hypothetical protein
MNAPFLRSVYPKKKLHYSPFEIFLNSCKYTPSSSVSKLKQFIGNDLVEIAHSYLGVFSVDDGAFSTDLVELAPSSVSTSLRSLS